MFNNKQFFSDYISVNFVYYTIYICVNFYNNSFKLSNNI